jgi:predicted nucleic acid-binding protein
MIVVADTAPLNYLIQIECTGLLAALYGEVVVPSAVLRELESLSSPAAVRLWAEHPPEWAKVIPVSVPSDPRLEFLGPGEREAIQISMDLGADLLLIDERKGRSEAIRRGLRTTGTLGVILTGAQAGLVDAEAAYRRLASSTSFRTTPALEQHFLAQIGRRQ